MQIPEQVQSGSTQPVDRASPEQRLMLRRERRHRMRPAIEAIRRRAYELTDLSSYGRWDRFVIRLADYCLYWLIKLTCLTTRWEVRGMNHLDSIIAADKRAIITFWHSCTFGAAWLWRYRGIVVMSSLSRDGEFTGRFIKRFGNGTARGSSSRGAGRALVEMTECLEAGIDVAFTIDGPRGPANVAKTGAVILARHTGHAILPFHAAARRRILLPTWDRMEIPLPFTRMLALIGEPIYAGPADDAEPAGSPQAFLQQALDNLRQTAEKWRTGR